MTKQYSDKEIQALLRKASKNLGSEKGSFDMLLHRMSTEEAMGGTTHTPPRVRKDLSSPYAPVFKIASACMAVFVVYFGVSHTYEPKIQKEVAVETSTSQTEIIVTPTDTSSSALATTETVPSSPIAASRKAVSKAAPNEVVELASLLENELSVENSVESSLFAISEDI